MPKRKTQSPGVLLRVLRMLVRDYPLQIVVVLMCIVIAAICGAAAPVFIERMTDCILTHVKTGWAGAVRDVLRLLTVMIAVYLLGLCASTIQTQIMARVTQGFLHNLRIRLFDQMQDLPISYFDTHNHGDIMSHYTNDVDALRQLVSQSIPSLITAGLTIICLLLTMIYFSLPLMLVVIVGIVAMTQVTRVVGGKSARYFKRQQESLGKVEGFVEEMMHGQKVIKVFCHEEAAVRDFNALNDRLYHDVKNANSFGNIFGPMMNNIGNILYVLMAFVGGLLVTSGLHNISLQNLLTTGSLLGLMPLSIVASYLGMVKQFTGNVNQVSQQINAVAMAMAGADRIFSLLDQKAEEDAGKVTLVNCREENGELVPCSERTGLWAWKRPLEGGEFEYIRLQGDVRFYDVDFSYVEGKTVLHNISLYAKPGQKLAFVGATGAGKTTITNLINRFYDIADGKIQYDGININHIAKADLRRSLGVVLQDVNLFTGTVMENIRYGKLDATDEACIKAAKLANAHDFITRLPQGYQTVLSGNGANLSQGQRQLLSIARAAVADPPVMILDEATSSIDTRTEQLVQKGMDALMEGRTVFVIAHRLSTVRNSNAILVLERGRIIERGDHEELIAQKGVYHSLYTGAFEME